MADLFPVLVIVVHLKGIGDCSDVFSSTRIMEDSCNRSYYRVSVLISTTFAKVHYIFHAFDQETILQLCGCMHGCFAQNYVKWV